MVKYNCYLQRASISIVDMPPRIKQRGHSSSKSGLSLTSDAPALPFSIPALPFSIVIDRDIVSDLYRACKKRYRWFVRKRWKGFYKKRIRVLGNNHFYGFSFRVEGFCTTAQPSCPKLFEVQVPPPKYKKPREKTQKRALVTYTNKI